MILLCQVVPELNIWWHLSQSADNF